MYQDYLILYISVNFVCFITSNFYRSYYFKPENNNNFFETYHLYFSLVTIIFYELTIDIRSFLEHLIYYKKETKEGFIIQYFSMNKNERLLKFCVYEIINMLAILIYLKTFGLLYILNVLQRLNQETLIP